MLFANLNTQIRSHMYIYSYSESIKRGDNEHRRYWVRQIRTCSDFSVGVAERPPRSTKIGSAAREPHAASEWAGPSVHFDPEIEGTAKGVDGHVIFSEPTARRGSRDFSRGPMCRMCRSPRPCCSPQPAQATPLVVYSSTPNDKCCY